MEFVNLAPPLIFRQGQLPPAPPPYPLLAQSCPQWDLGLNENFMKNISNQILSIVFTFTASEWSFRELKKEQ